MNTRTYSSIALAAIVIVAAFWWMTVDAWRQHENRQALAEWVGVVTGETLFRWDMNSPDEIVLNAARDIDRLEISNGALSGRTGSRKALVSLDLRGRTIAAEHYTRLRARVFSEGSTKWRLFHQADSDAVFISSGFVFVRRGWQELDLDLTALEWTARTFTPDGHLVDTRTGAWGGGTKTVSAVAIQPGRDPNTGFRIDYIEILRDVPPDARLEAITRPGPFAPRPLDRDSALDEQWLWVLAAGSVTPELALWLRDRARAAQPGALVFPEVPSAADLAPPPAPVRLFTAPVDSTRTGWGGTLLFVTAAGVWLLAGRRAWPRVRAGVDLFIAGSGGWFLLNAVQDAGQPPLWSFAWGLALLGFALFSVWRDGAPGGPGSRRAWAVTLALTLAVALVLLGAGMAGDRPPTGWPRAAAGYLPWALVQQFLMGPFFAVRARRVLHSPAAAALLTGALFGLLHFPNFGIMTGTLLMGTAWAWLFLRHGSFLPLAVSHAALAPLPLITLPAWLLRSAEVGARFWM